MQSSRFKIQVIAYNTSISASEKCGKWKIALVLLHEVDKVGLVPSIVGLNAAISSCGKGAMWISSLDVMECTHERCLSPNTVSCGAVLCSCEMGRLWEMAVALLPVGCLSASS